MNLQVGVKIILTNDKNEWLFLRRSKEMTHGGKLLWDIPGGRIEPTEALMTALAREVREEAGLILRTEPRLVAAQDIFVEPKDLHVVRLTYIGEADGKVTTSHEHSTHKWIRRDKLHAIEDLIDPYLKKVISTNTL